MIHSESIELNIEQLARTLQLSRGSFYWHFKDVESFRQLLLDKSLERLVQQWSQSGSVASLLLTALKQNHSELKIRGFANLYPCLKSTYEAYCSLRSELAFKLLEIGWNGQEIPEAEKDASRWLLHSMLDVDAMRVISQMANSKVVLQQALKRLLTAAPTQLPISSTPRRSVSP